MPNATRVGGAVGDPREVPNVAADVAAPTRPLRTRLPAGLTEQELLQGYARPAMHPVEAFALGGVLAASLAMLAVCWQGVAA